jgi:hypothetical protein
LARHLAPVPEDDNDRLGQEIIALIIRANRDLLSAVRR